MFWAWKDSCLDLLGVAARRLRDLLGQVRVLLYELGPVADGQAEQAVNDQHLAVTGRSRSDADGRDRERGGDLRRQRGRDAFKNHREGTCLFQFAGVGKDPLGASQVLALDLEPAQTMNALRSQAKVSHDRNTGFHKSLNQRLERPTAFELDGVRSEERRVGKEWRSRRWAQA